MDEDLNTVVGNLCKFHQEDQSPLKLEHFVLNRSGAGHDWGKFKQAIAELESRRKIYNDLRVSAMKKVHEASKVKIPKRFLWINSRFLKAKIRTAELELEHSKIQDMKRRLQALEREIVFLADKAMEYKSKLGISDDISPTKRAELEEEYWTHHLKQVALVSKLYGGMVSKEIFELMPHLPDNMRHELQLISKLELGEIDSKKINEIMGVDNIADVLPLRRTFELKGDTNDKHDTSSTPKSS